MFQVRDEVLASDGAPATHTDPGCRILNSSQAWVVGRKGAPPQPSYLEIFFLGHITIRMAHSGRENGAQLEIKGELGIKSENGVESVCPPGYENPPRTKQKIWAAMASECMGQGAHKMKVILKLSTLYQTRC